MTDESQEFNSEASTPEEMAAREGQLERKLQAMLVESINADNLAKELGYNSVLEALEAFAALAPPDTAAGGKLETEDGWTYFTPKHDDIGPPGNIRPERHECQTWQLSSPIGDAGYWAICQQLQRSFVWRKGILHRFRIKTFTTRPTPDTDGLREKHEYRFGKWLINNGS